MKKLQGKATIVLMIMMLFFIVGCGKKENGEKVEEKVQEENVEEAVAIEEDKKEEVTNISLESEEVQEEKASEQLLEEEIQKMPIYESPKEWMEAIKPEGTVVFVWNSETLENTILEEQMEYQIKENDVFYIYNSKGIGEFKFSPQTVLWGKETSETNTEPIMLFLKVNQTENVTVTEEINGETYEHHFTLMAEPEENVETSDEKMQVIDIDTDSDEASDVWIESLGTEMQQPFIVMLNDITGAKRLLEEAEVYQLQDGDKLFLYVPQGSICTTKDGPVGVLENTELKDNGCIWKINKSAIDDEVTFSFMVESLLGYEDISISCTLAK